MSISSGEQQSGVFNTSGGGSGGLRRAQRTIGDVMVNSITAIDEVVNSNDTFSVFNKPSTSFSNQPVQPLNNHDSRSIISSKSLSGELHCIGFLYLQIITTTLLMIAILQLNY